MGNIRFKGAKSTLSRAVRMGWRGALLGAAVFTVGCGPAEPFDEPLGESHLALGSSETNPTLITTLTGLQGMSGNHYYKLNANIDASATSGWNGGQGFVPIGTSGSPFTGTFDGNGFTISNLTINRPNGTSQGLFGYSQTAKITKLVMTGAQVSGKSVVGVAFGNLIRSEVTWSHAEGVVTGTGPEATPGIDHGILAGYIRGSVVKNSSARGQIYGYTLRAGGLAGRIEAQLSGPGMPEKRSDVAECYTRVTIAPSFPSNTYIPVHAGGLFGSAGGLSLRNVHSIRNVSGRGTVGGIVGELDNWDIPVDFAYAYSRGLVTYGAVASADNAAGTYGSSIGSALYIAALTWDNTVDTGSVFQGTGQAGYSTTALQFRNTSQEPFANGTDADWDVAFWNFGTTSQYPILRNVARAGEQLP